MEIKAIIFDMDGTLIDAQDWHYEALNEALSLFGEKITREEHLTRFDGLPTKEKLRILSEEGRIPSHLHSLIEGVKQNRTQRQIAANCFPSIQKLLMMSEIKALNLKIAVATNSIRRTAEIMLESSGLLEFLDTLVTNEDVNHSKPNPEIYELAATKLGILTSECFVIEDHNYGVQAARDAGCQFYKIESVDELNSTLIRNLLLR